MACVLILSPLSAQGSAGARVLSQGSPQSPAWKSADICTAFPQLSPAWCSGLVFLSVCCHCSMQIAAQCSGTSGQDREVWLGPCSLGSFRQEGTEGTRWLRWEGGRGQVPGALGLKRKPRLCVWPAGRGDSVQGPRKHISECRWCHCVPASGHCSHPCGALTTSSWAHSSAFVVDMGRPLLLCAQSGVS